MANQTQSAKSLVPTAPTVLFTVGRPEAAILRDIVEDARGNMSLREGATLTAPEVGFVIASQWKEEGSRSIKQANMLRLARTLPAVKDGDKEVPAFDYLKEQLWNARTSDGQFYNVFQLPEALDFMEKNAAKLGDKSSVFTVKDVLGKLRAAKAFDDSLSLVKKLNGPSKALVEALKEGATQKRIRELAEKVGAPKRKKAKSKTTVNDSSTKVEHTAESVKLAIETARGQWQLAVDGGVKVADIRALCEEELEKLALLGGFALVPIEKKK